MLLAVRRSWGILGVFFSPQSARNHPLKFINPFSNTGEVAFHRVQTFQEVT
jgi:hypothetical protein